MGQISTVSIEENYFQSVKILFEYVTKQVTEKELVKRDLPLLQDDPSLF